MKYHDRPIGRPREDLLGRSRFSLTLARAIDGLITAKDGFVIAIIGEWGTGKSSVMEMTLRYLTHLEIEHVATEAGSNETLDTIEMLAECYDLIRDRVAAYEVANFDLSKAKHSYVEELFSRWLGSKEAGEKAFRYWRFINDIEVRRKTVQVRFSPWLVAGRAELATALLSELARALGEKFGSDVKNAFASILKRLAEVAPIAGAGIDIATGAGFGKVISAGATWSSGLASKWTSGPTLDELRENLRTLLRSLNDRRVLIVVDDLDRLTPSEASEMVSLVKSLGDLPNVIYLLSYDQKNLEKLLDGGTSLNGRDYLQKIIQYPLHLPPISHRKLSKILDADLSELLGELDPHDVKRVGYTWHYIFRHFLKTPRDVRLYTNALTVSVSAQRDFVDPIDLMILELLRLHEPDLYSWIIRHLAELTQ
jgi:predicted KAP-like P-loop ATPase